MSLLSAVIVEKNFYKEKVESVRERLVPLARNMRIACLYHDLTLLKELVRQLGELEEELCARPPGDNDAPV